MASFDVPKRLHAAQHATGQPDAITPASIGAVAAGDDRLRDTGWRVVAISNANHPSITSCRLRRVGNTVALTITEATVSATGSGLSSLLTLPGGFTTSGTVTGAVINAQGGTPATASLYVSNGTTVVLGRVGGGIRHAGSLLFLTDDPWPATLPGTPA